LFVFLNALPAVDEYSGLLSFDWSFINNMWFVWVNMAFIILILTWLLYKPMLKFLDERRERIKNELKSAADNLKAAEETRATYDAKLLGVAFEREEILDAAKKTAYAREEEIITAAKNEADLIMERARREMDQEREKVRDEMHHQIVQVSAVMAEKLMASQLGADGAARERLLNQAIADLGNAE